MSEEKSVSFDPRIVLRPRSLDETFDLCFAYLRVSKRVFLRAMLGSIALALLLVGGLRYGLELEWHWVWCVALVVTPVIERVVLVYGGDHLFQNGARWTKAISRTLSRPITTLGGAGLISMPYLMVLGSGFDEEFWLGLGLMAGMFWPFGAGYLFFMSAVLLLENVPLFNPSGVSAWKRATTLVSYRYGRALIFLALSFSIRLWFIYLAEVMTHFTVSFVLQLGSPLEVLYLHGGSFASVAGLFAAAPVLAIARLFDYVDARTRLEGWDLQVRFKALAVRERSAGRRAA